ncbi:class I SAM-dependent methyltransferase [Massilia horti]|uniref:Class I SAM-dependent methyltransferase n=2 Tax=Massilia horti TaxID=2562153 RepID=A0A4Y9SSB8_9BURK|nr:class I SAM-dependent methyltransferase [Massilia horti]
MLLTVFVTARAGIGVGYVHVALLQGLLAAVISWPRLARWWLPIQFLFPLALVAAHRLDLPPSVFMAAFLLLLLVFWSTFRTQVPYYPSSRAVRDAFARLLPQDRPLCVIDIGSGLGGLVLDLARRRPESRASGIELAPLPWLVSRLRAACSGSQAVFLRGDYETLDFGQYDAIFAYLSPAAMEALWRKAAREMRPGSMLVSYEFPVPGHEPNLCVVPTDGALPLYVWHF